MGFSGVGVCAFQCSVLEVYTSFSSLFSFITLLIRLLVDAPATVDSQHKFSVFASRVLSDILIPNCVWRAGR